MTACHAPHAARMAACGAGGSAAQRVDLGVFGKPAELFFGEGQPAVDGDFEHAVGPFDQFDLGAVALFEPRPRTEGPWFIVSLYAVFDFDLHRASSERGNGRIQHSIGGPTAPSLWTLGFVKPASAMLRR